MNDAFIAAEDLLPKENKNSVEVKSLMCVVLYNKHEENALVGQKTLCECPLDEDIVNIFRVVESEGSNS